MRSNITKYLEKQQLTTPIKHIRPPLHNRYNDHYSYIVLEDIYENIKHYFLAFHNGNIKNFSGDLKNNSWMYTLYAIHGFDWNCSLMRLWYNTITNNTGQLILYGNIKRLPMDLGPFKYLHNITITHAGIKTIPDDFFMLCNAKIYDFSYNELSYIPQTFKSITCLCLRKNKLRKFPELSDNVGSLDISYNYIEEIILSTPIEYLYAQNNQIKKFENPDDIGELKHLYLSYNKLSKFPETLLHSELVDLDISHNLIQHIPDLSNMIALYELNAGYNLISSVTTPRDNMTNLKNLNLGHNKIHDIGFLSKINLEIFHINHNKITGISPDYITHCMRDIYANDNYIKKK